MATLNADLHCFSPNGKYLACLTHIDKLITIRNCLSDNHGDNGFQIICKFSLKSRSGSLSSVSSRDTWTTPPPVPLTPVESLQWSPDSCFLAAGCKKYAVVCVFSVNNVNWTCKIRLGVNVHGLDSFIWGKDGRQLLCLSQETTFMSIWSISSRKSFTIKDICPIGNCQGLSFSPDGSTLAVAQVSYAFSKSLPYHVAIYTASDYKEVKVFPVRCKHLAGLSWCPQVGSEMLCLWDSVLFANLYVYNAATGSIVKHFSPFGLSSSGFDCVRWTKSGEIVATAQTWNGLHVLNGLTFGEVIHDVLEPELWGDQLLRTGQPEIFYEVNKIPSLGMNKYNRLSKWPLVSLDASGLLQVETHLESPSPMTSFKLSSDGSHLAATTRCYPEIVWIYNLQMAVPVAVLIHQNPVTDMAWKPLQSLDKPENNVKLVMICDTPKGSAGMLYFWKGSAEAPFQSSAYMCNTTAQFPFLKVEWSPTGGLLALKDDRNRIHLFCDLFV